MSLADLENSGEAREIPANIKISHPIPASTNLWSVQSSQMFGTQFQAVIMDPD